MRNNNGKLQLDFSTKASLSTKLIQHGSPCQAAVSKQAIYVGRFCCAQVLVKSLVQEGARVVFGTIGSHVMPVYDALLDEHSIRNVFVKHEENAAVMADVYGRLTGQPGVCLVTAGPGATNTITGVAQAFAASSPLVHLSGTVSEPGDFHGVGDDPLFLQKVFRPVTKSSARVESAGMIQTVMADAFRLASTGRKGPTHVEIPLRMLDSEAQLKSKVNRPHIQTTITRKDVNGAYRIIRAAKRPVIFAGDQVLRYLAHGELQELAGAIQAPVVVSDNCLDAFPHDDPLFAGSLPGNFDGPYLNPITVSAVKRADLILLIGVDLQNLETRLILSFGAGKCAYIGSQRQHLRGSRRLEASLIGNIKHSLRALIQLVKPDPKGKMNSLFADQLAQQKRIVAEAFERVIADKAGSRPIHPGFVASTVRSASDRNAIITTDIGSHAIWVRDYFKAYEPLTYLETGNYGSMGFALPAAVAAKIVRPDRQVIAVTGDGGLLMAVMELATAVENKANITIVVMNDLKYGMIWHMQNLWHKGRHTGVDLASPDFAAVAQGFGARGIRVEDPSDLPLALKEALSSDNVSLVDVLVDHTPDYPSRTIFKRALRR